MYGYVVPYKKTLSAQDFVLFNSFYCGLCCQTGKTFGQLPRFTTNYDFAFFSALLHDYSSHDIVIEERKCVLNPVKKKPVLSYNDLSERIAAANILLSYKKAEDGVTDGDGIKYGAVKRMLKKPYKKAEKLVPDVCKKVNAYYELQRETEKRNISSVDRAAHPFATLMSELPSVILGRETDDNFKGLCYNIGKFAYLADALDDIADDHKKKRYNPFLSAFGEFKERSEFIQKHRADLEFIFTAICSRSRAHFEALKFTQSRSLLKNIICDGLAEKTKELLDSKKKLKPPRL